jgi:hypothetical protein
MAKNSTMATKEINAPLRIPMMKLLGQKGF